MSEVSVYNPEGTLVRVISKEKVSKLHWDKFVTGKSKTDLFHPAQSKTRTCQNCDKKFPATTGYPFKFCSPECRNIGTNKKPINEKACNKCGGMFLPKSSNMRYCHSPCMGKGK